MFGINMNFNSINFWFEVSMHLFPKILLIKVFQVTRCTPLKLPVPNTTYRRDKNLHIFAPMTPVKTRSSCREQMGKSPAPSMRCCTSDLPSWSCSPRRCSQTLEVLKMVWYYFSNNDIGNWLVLWCWNDCSFKTSTSIKIHFHLNASTP